MSGGALRIQGSVRDMAQTKILAYRERYRSASDPDKYYVSDGGGLRRAEDKGLIPLV